MMSFSLQTESGLEQITPVVTLSNGTSPSPIPVSTGIYRFDCGMNTSVTVTQVAMNFFTVIIHAPEAGISVSPPAGTYHTHTDLSFSFTVTPPPLTPEELLSVSSNGTQLPLPDVIEGDYFCGIDPGAPQDTFTMDLGFATPPDRVEDISGRTAAVAYREGELQLQGLDGCRIHLVSLTGAVFARFSTTETSPAPLAPATDYWVYPVRLPAGVYILYAEKEGMKRGAFKFVVR
jgi:hypothetical protein